MLVRHERDRPNLRLKDRKEEAVPLLGYLKRDDRHHHAFFSWREEAPGRHNRVVSTVLRRKNDVPHLADNLVIRAADLSADDLVRPQPRGKFVNSDEWLGVLLTAMALRSATLNLGISRRDLLLSLVLVIVAEAAHRRCRDELTDVGQKTLAISMTSVGPERESGVPQATQIADALPIGWPAKPRALKDCFFQLGVCNLAVRPRFCNAQRSQQSDRGDYCDPSHGSTPNLAKRGVGKRGLAFGA